MPLTTSSSRATTTTIVLGGLTAYVAFGYLTLNRPQRRAYFRPFTLTFSSIITLVGFGVNMVTDVWDAVRDGRTRVWRKAMKALHLFLKESGLDNEFDQALNDRALLPALMALTDLQNKVQRHRRVDLRQDTAVTKGDEDELQHLLEQGQHYMRFATAVYGPEMMASTQLAVYDEVLGYASDTHHQMIARHLQFDVTSVTPSPIMSKLVLPTTSTTPSLPSPATTPSSPTPPFEIWCDYTRDPTTVDLHHAQHCLVVCDHTRRQVIWTVRGTFSLSGIITDLAGYCTDFCGGYAHDGMARAARETWQTIWKNVLRDKLQALPLDYVLVLTGHSLGAGVACLVNILAHDLQAKHKEPALKKRTIRCFAMAPPPVFAPLSAASQAVANTVAYVHAYDIVPSLSVDAIRRLMACLDRLQNVLMQHPFWQLAAKRWELGEPQPELVQAYQADPKLRPLPTARMLVVPCRTLIWLERVPTTTTTTVRSTSTTNRTNVVYEAHKLDPIKYADRILDLELPDCVTDHMTPEYETALAKVLSGVS